MPVVQSYKNKLKNEYPRIYKWDQLQQQKVMIGEISKEHYFELRKENVAYVLDSEEEEKEVIRLKKVLKEPKNPAYKQKKLEEQSQT